jgi:hypothetical protein
MKAQLFDQVPTFGHISCSLSRRTLPRWRGWYGAIRLNCSATSGGTALLSMVFAPIGVNKTPIVEGMFSAALNRFLPLLIYFVCK